ncbi:hypothetical protein BVG88_06660 [Serratia marcescens]|uniref:hypothetical protein n=1 Tax=Serratia marcescens TaxID=615 RepID=UPI000B5E5138|nr:hypothetical protein [Serratia marcescens]ASM05320.1 hypothetical protein BVG88_06660 [Serratia marcescens]
MKQNPFSFYDFLGYLIPGALFLYILYFGGEHYHWGIATEARGYLSQNNNSLGELLNFLPLVILSYVLGHFLALVSSFMVEKYSNCNNGFPSQYLISGKGNGYFHKADFWSVIGRAILWVTILPISIPDIVTHWKFRQNKKMDQRLGPVVFDLCREILKEKFKMDTSSMDDRTGVDGDSFRLIYHYAFENSEAHASKLQNYVALYGFTRNIAMIFVIVFWTLILLKFGMGVGIGFIPIFTSVIMAFVFYKGFVKFYKRYTLEAMMAVCAIATREPK